MSNFKDLHFTSGFWHAAKILIILTLLFQSTLPAYADDVFNQNLSLYSQTAPPPGTSITPSITAPDGLPTVDRNTTLTLTTTSCGDNPSAYYTILASGGTQIAQGQMSGQPLRATVPPLTPYQGSATVRIMCGDIPPQTVINCNTDQNPGLEFSGLDSTQRTIVCNGIRTLATQIGGDANFLNLARAAARRASSPGLTHVTYQYSTTEGARWVIETGTVFMPERLLPPSDVTDEAADGSRSYLPQDWRTVPIYQNVTIMHESDHMIQAARPDIIPMFESVYDDTTDGFLYPSGSTDCRPDGRPAYEVEAQLMALVMEYGLLHDVSIVDLNTQEMDHIASVLTGENPPCNFQVRSVLVQKVQEVLRSLHPLEFGIHVDPGAPAPTLTSTRTSTRTSTPHSTQTVTLTRTSTRTATRLPTSTRTNTPRPTNTRTVTLIPPSPTRTRTPAPITATPTSTATNTLYPYGIAFVQTIPDMISPEKNLPGLFDGLTYPNYAIRDFNIGEAVVIMIEFASPATLSGFNAGFGGDPNRPDAYSVSIESATALSGPYQTILSNVPAPGVHIDINLGFGAPRTAKVFRVTVSRNDGDRRVHIYEMRPVFGTP